MSKRSPLHSVDPVLTGAFGALMALGILMVFSSSAIWAADRVGDPYYYLKRHFLYLALGLFAMATAAGLKPDFWRKTWFFLYLGTLLALLVTLVAGKTISGAKRWLYFGPIGFQFSELAKFALIVALARFTDRYQSKLGRARWALLYPSLIFAALSVPIALQPDFGGPFVMSLVFFTLLLCSGAAIKWLLVFPAMALPVFAGLILTSPYRLKRIFAYLSVWKSGGIAASGQAGTYQLSQALIALGSGGLLGKGLGDSELKLHYLPQPHTDFIYPVIGEELGFLGAMAVLLLFGIILLRGVRVAIRAQNQFARMMALGITFCLVYQATIHMAVTTALIPTKGITLPFVSYGGSSLVLSCLMAGILLRISRTK